MLKKLKYQLEAAHSYLSVRICYPVRVHLLGRFIIFSSLKFDKIKDELFQKTIHYLLRVLSNILLCGHLVGIESILGRT